MSNTSLPLLLNLFIVLLNGLDLLHHSVVVVLLRGGEHAELVLVLDINGVFFT